MTSYQDLRQEIWGELVRACVDRHHNWRTPVLSTVDEQGVPQARTVVLRKVLAATDTLTIFTDKRSPKVSQLLRSPQASLLFWCKKKKTQLRISVTAEIESSASIVNATWQTIKNSAAATDYLSLSPPSSALDGSNHFGSEQQLCIVHFTCHTMDYLQLSRSGHQRFHLGAGELLELVP